MLLYGHPSPSTSYTTIRVDGNDAAFGDYNGVITQAPTNGTTSSVSSWRYRDISVAQTLSFVTNPYTSRPDVVRISYRLTNTNTTGSHLVGVRIMLDTKLGDNDYAPFRIPGVGEVTYEREYTKAAHTTPQYWQAFDSLTSPTVTSQGTLIGNAATEPSKTQFTNWGRVYNTMWNYNITPASGNGDSAVSLIWNEVTLAHGQSVEYVTYYGIGSMTGSSNADIALTVSGPATLSVLNNAYSPNPFTVVAYVENKKVTDLTNVRMDLTLPAGLSNITPSTQYISTIAAGQAGQVSWSVRAAVQSSAKSLMYRVNASGSQITAPGVGVTRSILLPALTQKDKIGIFRNGLWQLDYNGNGIWNGSTADRQYTFGATGDRAVAGDWSTAGKTAIGYQRYGSSWYLDYNGNGIWNGTTIDRLYTFGVDDTPVAGDWNGNGKSEIGIFRSGIWYLDYNGNGKWDGTVTDRKYVFGTTGDRPVVGKWNGGAVSEIGIFRGNGLWQLDYNGNGLWNGTVIDRQYTFGMTGDRPVAGNWNTDPKSEIGIFRGNGLWQLDYNGNGIWNSTTIDRAGTCSAQPATSR